MRYGRLLGVLALAVNPLIGLNELRAANGIPAGIVEKVVNEALEHDQQEEFQRELLLKGESIYGVYPLNEANRKRFDAWKKSRPGK